MLEPEQTTFVKIVISVVKEKGTSSITNECYIDQKF